MNIDAIVIAGGKVRPQLAGLGVDCKSLLPILGKPMLEYVVRGLRSSKRVGRITVVGPPELKIPAIEQYVDLFVREGSDETDNIFLGIEALGESPLMLMTSSDLPLLDARNLDDFIDRCDGDICYPFVEKSIIHKMFPDREWVYVKVREGRFTGSSLFAFVPKVLVRIRDKVREVMDSRRSVPRLASLWGLPFLLKLALGSVSIGAAEKHLSSVLACRCRGIVSGFPEIAMDVDKLSDIECVSRVLSSRNDEPVALTGNEPSVDMR